MTETKKRTYTPRKPAPPFQVENPTGKPRMLTAKQAAMLVPGLSEYRIKQLSKEGGQLKAIKAGNKTLIPEHELLRFARGTS